jgi:CRP-like cAMP-binding protein/predicted GNAT family N-acyltransferase
VNGSAASARAETEEFSRTTEDSGLRKRSVVRALDDAHVRRAETSDEKEAAYRIRYEVYVEELGEFRFAADRAHRLLTDATDDTARHYYVTFDNHVIGALRYHLEQDEALSDEENAIYDLPKFRNVVGDQLAILSRFNVHKDFRYSHVPADLLQKTIPFAEGDGVELLFCTCMPHLLNLYFKLGFRSCGPIYNDAVASVITPLVLIRGDIEHFRRIGSPLADFVKPSARSVAVARKVRALLSPPSARQVTEEQWEEVFRTLQMPAGSVFEGLTLEESRAIVTPSFLLDVRKNDRIVREKQFTRTIFIIVSGHFRVNDNQNRSYQLDPGAVFGEESFLLNVPRTGDVYVTSEKACVLALSERVVRQLCDSHTRTTSIFLLNLSRGLARKITRTAP